MVAPPNTSNITDVESSGGKVQITIAQISQDLVANTSEVQVTGVLETSSTSGAYHGTADISCSITGTESYTGAPFNLVLGTSASKTFIDHTFTVTHGSDGNKTVNFTVNYGVTGTTIFGSNHSSSDSLDLSRIPNPPSVPGNPTFSNELPTTLTVSWTAPADDGGSPIDGYLLRRFTGDSFAGVHYDYIVKALFVNLKNLTPGAFYKWIVFAHNGSKVDNGYSPGSGDENIQTVGGLWVKYHGTWHVAIPYVRYGGKWKIAIPYVRNGGVWKLTE